MPDLTPILPPICMPPICNRQDEQVGRKTFPQHLSGHNAIYRSSAYPECLATSRSSEMTNGPSTISPEKNVEEKKAFEQAVKLLEGQIANVGAHLTIDTATRIAYSREIKTMSNRLRERATCGKISWNDAAKEANETRNLILEIFRSRSTAVGRAMAQKLKIRGTSLNHLVAGHTVLVHGAQTDFSRLTQSKKNAVYASIVASAGRSNPKVNTAMTRLSFAGRGLLVMSIGISAYNIAMSNNKLASAGQELASTSASIGGGLAGGALAGLACGPAAPVCVTIGAFVGGAVAAFGVRLFW